MTKEKLKSETVVVTPFYQNCRVLFAADGGDAVVVDPGGDAGKILDFLKKHSLTCKEIWLTHSHLDHCGGVAPLKKATNAKLLGSKLGAQMRQSVEKLCAMYGIEAGELENSPEPERFLKDGEVLNFAGVDFLVLETPGHSPDHLCFYAKSEKLLIAGDTLFAGSIGRTDLPGGNHAQLLASIRNSLLTLPGDTKVQSGHGPDTMISIENGTNPFLAQ
jgi:hydroxyacylglutathione hydrolase